MDRLGAAWSALQDLATRYRHRHQSGLLRGDDGAESTSSDCRDAEIEASEAPGDAPVAASGRLYVSSIALNLGLSCVVLLSLSAVHKYYLTRHQHLRDRAVIVKKMREALGRWERPCLAEVYECWAVPRTEAQRREIRAQLMGLLRGRGWRRSGVQEADVDAVLSLWLTVAASDAAAAAAAQGDTDEELPSSEEKERREESTPEAGQAFHGMVSSVVYASDFPFVSLMRLCTAGDVVLQLDADRALLRRLECVVRYAVFRRIALLEEVCYHAHLWRRTVLAPRAPWEGRRAAHGGEGEGSRAATRPPAPALRAGYHLYHAWRVYGRPSWLIPYTPPQGSGGLPAKPAAWAATTAPSGEVGVVATRVRHYLSLPISYYPLEAVRQSTTGWGREYERGLMPRWERGGATALCHVLGRVVHLAEEEKWLTHVGGDKGAPVSGEGRRLLAEAATHLWFLAYASPLYHQMSRARDALCAETDRAQLFRGVAYTTGRGCDELLFDCGAASLSRSHPTSPYGVSAVFFSSKVQRDILLRLTLRAATLFTESAVMAITRVATYDHLSQAISVGVAKMMDRTLSGTAGAHGGQPTEVVMRHALRAFLLLAVGRALKSVLPRLGNAVMSPVARALQRGALEEAKVALANVDDGFLSRAAPDGATGTESLGMGEGGESSYRLSVPRLLTSTPDSCLPVEDFEQRCRRAFDIAFEVGLPLVRGELLAFASVLAFRWLESRAEELPQRLGLSEDPKAVSALRHLEQESLPTNAPHGLRLVLEILAESEDDAADPTVPAVPETSEAPQHLPLSQPMPLRYPFLSLVACAGVWDHSWLQSVPGEGGESGESGGSTDVDGDEGQEAGEAPKVSSVATRHARAVRVRRLYHQVVSYPYVELLAARLRTREAAPHCGGAVKSSCVTRWRARRTLRRHCGCGSARALGEVEVLIEDVHCITYFALDQECKKLAALAVAARRKQGQLEEEATLKTQRGVEDEGSAGTAGRPQVPPDGKAERYHPAIDPVEVAIMRRRGYHQYLPTNLKDTDIFGVSSRYVLRMLGLELVFAQRVIRGMEEAEAAKAGVDLDDCFGAKYQDPLGGLLGTTFYFLSKLAFIAATCTAVSWTEGWHMKPRPAWEVLLMASRVPVGHRLISLLCYREFVRPVNIWIPVAIVGPASIGDQAMYARAPSLVARRRAWQTHLQQQQQQLPARQGPEILESAGADVTKCPLGHAEVGRSSEAETTQVGADLRFDACARICGGFRMRKGIAFHHVTFAYPQLHHYENLEWRLRVREATRSADSCTATPASVRFARQACLPKPTLEDANAFFPATAMTALVGPTGSGKSSVARLLKRSYDPVAVVAVLWPSRMRGRGLPHAEDTAAQGLSSAKDSEEPEEVQEEWSESLLCDVLWLQWVENPLPLPPPMTLGTEAEAVGTQDHKSGSTEAQNQEGATRPVALLPQRGFVTWDDIPVSCFSSDYLRRWLAYLDQDPSIDATLTFEDNIRFVSPGVTPHDVELAARLCCCEPFIKKAPLGMQSPTTTLSGGERQRLALARVLTGVRARVRLEAPAMSFFAYDEHRAAAEAAAATEDGSPHAAPLPLAEGGLLLDEPTSRLDALNELLVQQVITGLLPGSRYEPAPPRGRPSAEREEDGVSPLAASSPLADASASATSPQEDVVPPSPESFRTALPNLMVISIAHRMATLRRASYMVVVEHGRVTNHGPTADVQRVNAFVQRQMALQNIAPAAHVTAEYVE